MIRTPGFPTFKLAAYWCLILIHTIDRIYISIHLLLPWLFGRARHSGLVYYAVFVFICCLLLFRSTSTTVVRLWLLPKYPSLLGFAIPPDLILLVLLLIDNSQSWLVLQGLPFLLTQMAKKLCFVITSFLLSFPLLCEFYLPYMDRFCFDLNVATFSLDCAWNTWFLNFDTGITFFFSLFTFSRMHQF